MPLPEQNNRGVKRRRVDKESKEDIEAKLRRKLHHALRELRKVVKKARTFEVQKTVKKLKDARRKNPESDATKDLESQMEILKHLDYDLLAHSALLTKLKKDKTLSADPLIQAIAVELASSVVSPGAPGSPTAKVHSRILSSKVIASEVMSMVESLKTFLHPSEATDGSPTLPEISKKRTETSHKKATFSFKDNDNSPGEGSEGEYDNEAIAGVDDGWESGTVGAPSGSDGSAVESGDDHDTDETDFFSEDPKNKKPRIHETKGQSEFLPSLSVGFTRGDSDSEFSDSETKLVDGIKKNRRGQRARRAIWEKKFGKNANHIRKQRQDMLPGPKRHTPVPVDNADRRSRKGDSSLRSRHTPAQSRALGFERVRKPTLVGSGSAWHSGSTVGDVRGKQGDRPLHPSWEAKRKEKAASIVPSQGTKIVFSET